MIGQSPSKLSRNDVRAHLESIPIEAWHLRHTKYDAPCRVAQPTSLLLPGREVVPMPLRDGALSEAWATEYVRAVDAIKARARPRLGEAADAVAKVKRVDHHPSQMGQIS